MKRYYKIIVYIFYSEWNQIYVNQFGFCDIAFLFDILWKVETHLLSVFIDKLSTCATRKYLLDSLMNGSWQSLKYGMNARHKLEFSFSLMFLLLLSGLAPTALNKRLFPFILREIESSVSFLLILEIYSDHRNGSRSFFFHLAFHRRRSNKVASPDSIIP